MPTSGQPVSLTVNVHSIGMWLHHYVTAGLSCRPAALEDELTGLSVAPPMAMPTGTATDTLVWCDILTTGAHG